MTRMAGCKLERFSLILHHTPSKQHSGLERCWAVYLSAAPPPPSIPELMGNVQIFLARWEGTIVPLAQRGVQVLDRVEAMW